LCVCHSNIWVYHSNMKHVRASTMWKPRVSWLTYMSAVTGCQPSESHVCNETLKCVTWQGANLVTNLVTHVSQYFFQDFFLDLFSHKTHVREYDNFCWKCYTPEILQIEKLKFLRTNSNQTKIWIWFLFCEILRNLSFCIWWISRA